MKSTARNCIVVLLALSAACSSQESRGIADKRSDFTRFIPMTKNPAEDGLKEVRPYFQRADRGQIMHAIDRACSGGRSGSSVYDEAKHTGYYVNCNPRNRQLLNGYVPLNPKEQPHSR